MIILESNKLIAEFMGWKYSPEKLSLAESLVDTEGNFYYGLNALKFNSSWDWLMPVVEKIESLGYDTIISKGMCVSNSGEQICVIGEDFCYDEYDDLISDPVISKLEATYKAVVEFIKWYNKQKS